MRRLFRIHIPCYEFEDFSRLIEYGKTPEQICYHRTMNCLEWYIRKAIFYKRIFYLLSMVNLLLPLLSTAIMAWKKDSDIGIILSACTSLSASLLALFNARDKWTSYRTAAENIKRQYALYCAKVEPFDDENAHSRYIMLLEQYMTEVHTHWCDMQAEEIKEEKK